MLDLHAGVRHPRARDLGRGPDRHDRRGGVLLLGTFETKEAGEYRLSCSPYVSNDSVYITDVGVGGMVGGAFAGIGLGLLGGLLFIVGIILIIVNRVSASKNRR